MNNPILQLLNQGSQTIQRLNQIKQAMSGKNPDDVYKSMMQSNPQFKQFIQENEGKSLEEIALSYDIDVNLIKQFIR